MHKRRLSALFFVVTTVLGLLVFADSEEAHAQGVVISLDTPPVVAPLPTPERWRGISIGFTEYAWLDFGRARPTSFSEVTYPTLMFSFRQGHNYHPSWKRLDFVLPNYTEPLSFNGYRSDKKVQEYWQKNLVESISKKESDKAKGLVNISVPIKFPKLVRSLIGEGGAGLRVNGRYRVSFDGRSQWDDRTQTATYKQSKFPSLNMEQVSQFKITGTIGSKIEVQVDQDSKRQTDLDNRIQIRYSGTEDDIIQTIEAGNTNLSLPNTQFVGYAQRVQGLFGIKATAKVGNLGITAITSQEKGNTEKSNYTSGSQESVLHIRDYNYKKDTFFWLGIISNDPADVNNENVHLVRGVHKIVDMRLFLQETSSPENADRDLQAGAYVYPDRPELFIDESADTATWWTEIERDKYIYYENELYLEMLSSVSSGRYLACWLVIEDDNGVLDTIGDLTSSPNTLLLLRSTAKDENYVTFNYEWKNVYDIRARDLSPDDVDVQIFKGAENTETNADDNLDHQNGTKYIELLGLDTRGLGGEPPPDGRADLFDDQIFFADRGFIIFPSATPFASDALDEPVPEIYNEANSRTITEASKYYIEVKTKSQLGTTEISLGRFNIIEGSEVVRVNGRQLVRDRDYTIYYDLGRIIFRTDEVASGAANVDIDYEYQPFFAAEKKSLFGSRLEYVLSKNTEMGATVLYKSEKSTDRKPRVGQEQSKYLVWDADLSTRFEMQLLTDMLDALPLIEATAPSHISVSGEVAQSLPNPNTEGEAYIDDFEGSKEAYNLSVLRYRWTKSSFPPADSIPLDFFENLDTNPRGRLIWYNPFDEIPITDIWNRDVRDRDDRTHVMVLEFKPDSTISDRRNSWAGIMRPISVGAWDQTRTQFLEIRMLEPRGPGKMLIHLGQITEDIDADGILDTEDFAFGVQNDILDVDKGEDVGLDRMSNDMERDSIRQEDWYSEEDPAGDDWDYDPEHDPDNYEKINGTEGNGSGNHVDPTGVYPDTEDINSDRGLDITNAYFEYVLDFENAGDFRVEASEKPSDIYRDEQWVTYRIPLRDASLTVGNAALDRIEFARLIFTGADENERYVIASMDLVSTRWLNVPMYTSLNDDGSEADFTRDSLLTSQLKVSVINNEENTDYQAPPGVAGYFDQITETTEKEQSLWLQYKDIPTGVTAIAERILATGAENYAGYKHLKMFVHSDSNYDSTYFIFRMGSNSDEFYEFRTPLKSATVGMKWNPDFWVDIDLDEITRVKDSLNHYNDSAAVDTVNLDKIDMLRLGKYGVRGRPRMTAIKYFSVGVERTLPENPESPNSEISGDLWLDELRVTDVRRDKGTAGRISVTANLSDVGSFSVRFSKQDEYFRQLTASDRNNLGSGRSNSNFSLSSSFNLHKFLPPKWGANIPLSFSYSKTEQVPRLKSGSDIVITDADRESETTRSYSRSINTSIKFNRNTNNWLWNLTLNKISTNFSYSNSSSRSPSQPYSRSQSYRVRSSYNLTTRDRTFRVFAWTRLIPFFPQAITNSEMGYLPKRITMDGNLTGSSYESRNASSTVPYSQYNQQFTGNASIAFDLFKSLPLSFSMRTDRDLRDASTINFSFNPSSFQLGIETRRNQSFTASYDPRILSFLTTGFSYKSSYDENADPKRYTDGTRLGSVNSNVSVNSKFDARKFFGTGKDGDFVLLKPILWIVRPVVGKIDPIAVSYSQDNRFSSSGMVERPSLKFQFGLTKDPGVEIKESSGRGGARNFSDSKSEAYSGKSGIAFILGSKISTGYSHRISSSAVQKSISKSTTFPDLGVSFGRLEKFPMLKWVFTSLSVDSRYNRKVNSTENKTTGLKEKEDVSHTFSPLMGFNVSWLRGVKTTGKIDYSTSSSKTFTGSSAREQRSTAKGWTLTNNFSFRSPTGLAIPLLGRLKFQSTMNLSLDISKRTTKAENVDAAGNKSPASERTDLTISPRASYSFSTNIQGGMNMRWTDSEDKNVRRKSHIRQIGIWVEIRF